MQSSTQLYRAKHGYTGLNAAIQGFINDLPGETVGGMRAAL